jgi:hypothetical protein
MELSIIQVRVLAHMGIGRIPGVGGGVWSAVHHDSNRLSRYHQIDLDDGAEETNQDTSYICHLRMKCEK